MTRATLPKSDAVARPFETSPNRQYGEVSNLGPRPQTRTNLLLPQTGTDPAISYLTLGVAANLPRTTQNRGGARNHASRESHELTAAQVGNLINATRHAYIIGLPFTRMITIHWQAAGLSLEAMVTATGKFTDLLAKSLTRHGNGTAWAWVHENGDGKGGHCHMLAHVPAALAPIVAKLQKGWLRRITGKPYRARVICSKPIGGRLGLEVGNPDLHSINLDSALGYILKCASVAAASRCDLTRLERGGRVIGKRCGISQNIGAKARKADSERQV